MKYLKLFKNSDLRDTYESGSNYIEPYVSYTPIVIDGYEAQFNGETVNEFKVKKIQGGYEIEFYVFDEPETVEVLTNSDSFYFYDDFIFPEDLNLTEESTELTFDGNTYYLVYNTSNRWNVYDDSEHTQGHGRINKFNIVSVLSTDFVHYNKIPPAKSIYAKIKVEYNESSDQPAVMRRKISSRNDIFEKIIVDGNEILFNNEEPVRGVDFSVYYTFSSEGIYNVEYVLKDEYAGIMPGGIISSSSNFVKATLPKGIYKIKSEAFSYIYGADGSFYMDLTIPDTVTEVENCAVRCTNVSQEAEDFLLSINPNSICNNCK